MQRALHSRRALILCALWGLASLASANDNDRAPLDLAYVEECGTCHTPYPAELMRADSWKLILGGLEQHFKVDASPDEAALKPIREYLLKHARRKAPVDDAKPLLKISESRWFRMVHQEARNGTWPRVKTMGNCGACHPRAQEGHFHELVDPKDVPVIKPKRPDED